MAIASSEFTAFGVGAGEVLAAVQVAMIAGLPYTALRRRAVPRLTQRWSRVSLPLFSSAASAHNLVEEKKRRHISMPR